MGAMVDMAATKMTLSPQAKTVGNVVPSSVRVITIDFCLLNFEKEEIKC